VEKKKTSKIQVCIDFHNLNKATPKDEYPMPIANMLVNNTSGHRVISFLDGNAGYNQIFMAQEDMSKMAFRYPGVNGLFEWVVMTFGLKNTDTTYRWAMNLIFHDLLGVTPQNMTRWRSALRGVHWKVTRMDKGLTRRYCVIWVMSGEMGNLVVKVNVKKMWRNDR
jgi:hypothetical protein